MEQMVKVVSKNGIVIWGKVINNFGKLGQYEVHSPQHKQRGVFSSIFDAEKELDHLIGVKNSKQ